MSSRIVVVEDEPKIQALIVDELKDEGYEVATANNGREGLEVIRNFKPMLILSDITMPEMDGHEMLKALRTEYKTMRSVPIVFLSALADREHILEGKRLGADDYLTKPIDFEMLLVTIEARLREIQRMTEEKEEQMLKLYATLQPAKPGEAKVADKPILIIANQWSELDHLMSAISGMKLSGHVRHMGSKLDEYLSERTHSALMMTHLSNDLTAKLAIMNSAQFQGLALPKLLILENEAAVLEDDVSVQFDSVVYLDQTTDEIHRHLSEYIAHG